MNATHIEIVEKVNHSIELASHYFNKRFTTPEVRFNQRGKIAGSAHLQKNELRFNPVLLQDNLDTFLKEVVPHEVCHLIAHQLYGRVRPHGKEWQALMIELFDLPPLVHHKMDVNKVAGQQFKYACECTQVDLSIRRHNKVLTGKQQYYCRKCKGLFTQVNPSF